MAAAAIPRALTLTRARQHAAGRNQHGLGPESGAHACRPRGAAHVTT